MRWILLADSRLTTEFPKSKPPGQRKLEAAGPTEHKPRRILYPKHKHAPR